MPTEVVSTIGPDGDYTSLAAWNSAVKGDLVAADTIQIADCFPMADSGNVYFSGWTTDADHYIIIRSNAAHRNNGIADSAICYYTDGKFVLYGELHIEIDGIICKQLIDFSGYTGNATVKNCISVGGTYVTFLYTNSNVDPNCKFFFYNNIAWDCRGAGTLYAGIRVANGTVYAYNNTFYYCNRGIYSDGGTVIAKNNIAMACTSYGYIGAFDPESTNNASDRGDAPGSNPINGSALFVDAAARNLHIQETDTVAKEAGVNLSADLHVFFNKDIDGTTRGSVWSCGADDFPGASILQGSSSWRVRNSSGKTSGWNTRSVFHSSSLWNIVVAFLTQAQSSWNILSCKSNLLSWNNKGSVLDLSGWNVKAALSQEVLWNIAGVFISKGSAYWNVLARKNNVAAWNIQKKNVFDILWNSRAALNRESSWTVLNIHALDVASAWNILTLDDRVLSWVIKARTSKYSFWNEFGVKGYPSIWNIGDVYIEGTTLQSRIAIVSFDARIVTVAADDRTILILE